MTQLFRLIAITLAVSLSVGPAVADPRPTSPVEGATYADDNAKPWRFDSGAWVTDWPAVLGGKAVEIETEADVDLRAMLTAGDIRTGQLVLITNRNPQYGINVSYSGTLNLLHVGRASTSTTVADAQFNVGPKQVAFVTYDGSRTNVVLFDGRDKGYYADATSLAGVEINTLATGDYAMIGPRLFVYDGAATGDDVAVAPADRVGEVGGWMTTEGFVPTFTLTAVAAGEEPSVTLSGQRFRIRRIAGGDDGQGNADSAMVIVDGDEPYSFSILGDGSILDGGFPPGVSLTREGSTNEYIYVVPDEREYEFTLISGSIAVQVETPPAAILHQPANLNASTTYSIETLIPSAGERTLLAISNQQLEAQFVSHSSAATTFQLWTLDGDKQGIAPNTSFTSEARIWRLIRSEDDSIIRLVEVAGDGPSEYGVEFAEAAFSVGAPAVPTSDPWTQVVATFDLASPGFTEVDVAAVAEFMLSSTASDSTNVGGVFEVLDPSGAVVATQAFGDSHVRVEDRNVSGESVSLAGPIGRFDSQAGTYTLRFSAPDAHGSGDRHVARIRGDVFARTYTGELVPATSDLAAGWEIRGSVMECWGFSNAESNVNAVQVTFPKAFKSAPNVQLTVVWRYEAARNGSFDNSGVDIDGLPGTTGFRFRGVNTNGLDRVMWRAIGQAP